MLLSLHTFLRLTNGAVADAGTPVSAVGGMLVGTVGSLMGPGSPDEIGAAEDGWRGEAAVGLFAFVVSQVSSCQRGADSSMLILS